MTYAEVSIDTIAKKLCYKLLQKEEGVCIHEISLLNSSFSLKTLISFVLHVNEGERAQSLLWRCLLSCAWHRLIDTVSSVGKKYISELIIRMLVLKECNYFGREFICGEVSLEKDI